MIPMTQNDFMFTLAGAAFLLGLITFIVGIFILAFKVTSADFNDISSSSAKLVKKGLTEDVSDLVNNASSLLGSIAQMSRTRAGVGMFLVLVAVALLIAAYLLVTRLA